MRASTRRLLPNLIFAAAILATIAVYWSGLSGGFLFDDYPNIVENRGVQPPDASLPSLVRAALSSPSSEFKRPLASLSFAANYLATGLDPYWMKLTNLIIHLLNGLLVFLLARALVVVASKSIAAEAAPTEAAATGSGERTGVTAALIAGAWMLLPINLTAVVYVVQRMESMANLFVLLGLIGYMAGRQRMLAARTGKGAGTGLLLCISSLILGTVFGLLAKETAVMLPLYAFLVEWIVLNFRAPPAMAAASEAGGTHLTHRNKPDSPLQALGHADLVMTPKGDWWATLLAIRPQQAAGGRHHHIGRETLLAPVRWREDGWPEFGQGGVLEPLQPTTGLPGWQPWPQPAVRETFAADRKLPLHWTFLRTLAAGKWSLTARLGQLRLIGARNGLDTIGTPAFVGRRQEHLNQRFATEVDFSPADAGDAAGLALRMNESHHALLRVTGAGEQRRVECVLRTAGEPRALGSAPAPAGALQLQVRADP